MEENHVVVGLDTNILINFGTFRNLAWKALFPGVTKVTVLISAKVMSEMDVHKDQGAGYVRKRAKEFQQILRATENNEYVTSFEAAGVNVKCIFLERPHRNVLDHDTFDLSNADELIVAQYHFARADHGDIVVLANDGNTIRSAKRANMRSLRPDAWVADRSEPEDETTRILREKTRELERIIGARPKVELELASQPISVTTTINISPDFDLEAFKARMRTALTTNFKLPTRQDLIDKFGMTNPMMGNMGRTFGGISVVELNEWEEEVEAFRGHFDEITTEELRDRLSRILVMRRLNFSVFNEGTAQDENLLVEIDARDNARIIAPDTIETLNDWHLKTPKPPEFQRFPSLGPMLPPSPQNEHDLVRTERSDDRVTYKCRVFMQGVRHNIQTWLFAQNRDAPSKLLITLRSKNLLDPVTREVVLAPTHRTLSVADIETTLLQGCRLMPRAQAKVLTRIFEK